MTILRNQIYVPIQREYLQMRKILFEVFVANGHLNPVKNINFIVKIYI